MYPTSILPRSFFRQSALHVARELLGKRLVHIDGDKRIGGIIIETEAYCGEDDLACHAKAGRTARTELMYGPAGHAYIYLNYGMHWLFNCVTASVGDPQAVLIRALLPTEGVEAIAQRRAPQPEQRWTDG
ncbi:MAG: DNA-3-methyladenine glycosylase, partial [Chloroflexota bacterium]